MMAISFTILQVHLLIFFFRCCDHRRPSQAACNWAPIYYIVPRVQPKRTYKLYIARVCSQRVEPRVSPPLAQPPQEKEEGCLISLAEQMEEPPLNSPHRRLRRCRKAAVALNASWRFSDHSTRALQVDRRQVHIGIYGLLPPLPSHMRSSVIVYLTNWT